MREHLTQLHDAAVSAFEREAAATGGGPPDVRRVRNAIWVQTHNRPFEYFAPRARNRASFTCRTCPQCRSFRASRLPWAAAVEARTAEVRDEYLAAVAAGAVAFALRRRVHPRTDLAGLARQARLVFAAPLQGRSGNATCAPVPEDAGGTGGRRRRAASKGGRWSSCFRGCRPGAHIPPHFGTENHRITVHLPLIVPGDCEIRVGSARHAWREGELFAFDDSYEHEAWNRSGKDRVVLIFQAHNPDLRPEERAAIEHAIGAGSMDQGRRRPPGFRQRFAAGGVVAWRLPCCLLQWRGRRFNRRPTACHPPTHVGRAGGASYLPIDAPADARPVATLDGARVRWSCATTSDGSPLSASLSAQSLVASSWW